MKKIILTTLLIILGVINLHAIDIAKINNNFVLNSEIINNAILKNEKNNLVFEKLSEKEKKKLIITLIKAIAVYNKYKGKLDKNSIYQNVEGKPITFKGYYNYQLENLRKNTKNEKEFELKRALLFYTLWTAQEIKKYTKEITVTDKDLKNAYEKLNYKFNIPEKRTFILIQSEKENKIKKLINEFSSKKEKTIGYIEDFLKKANEDKDIKVIEKLNQSNGVLKTDLEKEVANKIWNIKENDINKKPIKFKNKYFIVYITQKIPKKQYSFEEVKDTLKLSVKKYKLMQKLTNDINKAIKAINIKSLIKIKKTN